jgi:putative flippase GtrA
MALASLLTPRFLRFLAVGVLNTGVGYALFAAIILYGSDEVVAAAGSTALGALFNFQSIGGLVFRQRALGLLPRFLGVYVGQCGANILMLAGLGSIGVGPLLGQFLLLPFLATGTYLAMQSFVFRDANAR